MLAVGGQFDAQNNDYSQSCEVFDLSTDLWTKNAKIKVERLSPFMIPIGLEKALLIGGFKRTNRRFDETLIKQAEIVDTAAKASYFPASNYKLPADVKSLIGAFKIGQEMFNYQLRELDLLGVTRTRAGTNEALNLDAEDGDTSLDELDPRTLRYNELTEQLQLKEESQILIESVVVIYLNAKSQVRT